MQPIVSLFGRTALVLAVAAPVYLLFAPMQHHRSGCSLHVPAPSQPAPMVTVPASAATILPGGRDIIDSAEFGLKRYERGESLFEPSSSLPIVAGTSFGWRLKLKDPTKSVRVREVFRLPQRPAHWGYADETHLLDDEKLAITDILLMPENGMIDHGWVVSEGDPLGAYAIQVLIDDVLVARFDFAGVAP